MFLYVVLAALGGVVAGVLLTVLTKKKETVTYGVLDKVGIATNIALTAAYTAFAPFYMFLGMICEPHKEGFLWFVGLIISLICGSAALFAGLGIGFSVSLRKKGRSVLSFVVQFAGVVAIVLTFAFYAIFVGNLLSPLN